MMKAQQGFTLIELIVVIVILGILAATALPKYINLKNDAAQAATDGVAGALSSAAAVNFSGRLVSTTHGVAVTNCADVTSAMAPMPSGYAATQTTAVTAGGTAACTVTNTANSTSSTYTAIGS